MVDGTCMVGISNFILLAGLPTFSVDSQCSFGEYFDDKKQRCEQGRIEIGLSELNWDFSTINKDGPDSYIFF